MEEQINLDHISRKFVLDNMEYDAEIIITIQCNNTKLRELIMNSIYVDKQNGKLYYEASLQSPDTLSWMRRIYVKEI